MSQAGRTFDLVIFGATSFTGKWLLREVVKILENGNQFTWAISGRSLTKMDGVLREISNEIGKELQVPRIVADVKKPSTIAEMVKQCRVLLNLVGPYIEFGEVVVNACAQEGTHYVDVHGEPLFAHRIEEKYSSVAERSGAYIVGSCGLGVIPSDCGAAYLEKHFDGEELSSIESFLELVDESGNVSFANMKLHSGSYHSVILMLHHIRELLAFKSKRSEKFPQPDHKLVQSPFTFRKEVNGWTLSELPIGEIMAKSQEYAVLKLKRKPIQIASYTVFSSVLPIVIMILMGIIVAAIAQFKLGVQFLLKVMNDGTVEGECI